MRAPFADLLDDLDRIPVSRGTVQHLLGKMDRDLRAAERNRDEAPEWAIAIAHQAILNGCLAVMAAHGYRARINGHHRVAIEFTRRVLSDQDALLVQADRLRRQRHRAVYGMATSMSASSAARAVVLAQRLAPVLRGAALSALGTSNPHT